MPRSLVLGNGNMLVCLDHSGQIKDFYYPYVGLEHHTENCTHKIGVWVDNHMSWIDNGDWDININYKKNTLASTITAINRKEKVTLRFDDIVYNEQNIFLRTVTVTNSSAITRPLKLFLHQQFKIQGLTHGNTAFFHPHHHAIIHYRGRHVFLVGGRKNSTPFDEYSIGLFNSQGQEGTWRDAEDGHLSSNPVEHGLVDSVIGFSDALPAGKSFTASYWITAAPSFETAIGLQKYILTKSPEHLQETTQDYWWAWVNKTNINFQDFDNSIISLFKHSLLIMRTHVDNRGGIIASGDASILQGGKDTYSYVWPRDAAFTAMAFDHAGYHQVAERFFKFAHQVLNEEGYFLHKYHPDGSPGSSWHPWIMQKKPVLPIQEDETALVLIALWKHYIVHRNIEYVERVYNTFIKKIAIFLSRHRDKNTGLPLPSYDLWEERFQTTVFTSSAVYAALTAASNFAQTLGKEEDAIAFYNSARGVREATLRHFYHAGHQFICRGGYVLPDGSMQRDCTPDISSFYALFTFGILKPDDMRLAQAYRHITNSFCVKTGCLEEGAIRYQDDRYQSVNEKSNPWFVTTLWLAQYAIAASKTQSDLEKALEGINWAAKHASPAGLMSEQINAETKKQTSVAPLTWSHAEFITTVLSYLKKKEILTSRNRQVSSLRKITK